MPLNTTNEYVVSHLSKGPSLVPTRQILTPVLDFCCPEASGFDELGILTNFILHVTVSRPDVSMDVS